MDHGTAQAYLDRIGAVRPERPDLPALRHLQERHVRAVPFENLGYHLGEDVHTDERVLDKIVRRGRGGGCYETNPAFALLLRALGFTADLVPGRVYRDGVLGPPLCHLAVRVRLGDERYLVDTGFGRNSLHPLAFDVREEQQDPHGAYLLVDAGGGEVDVLLDGRPLYRVDDRPVTSEDLAPTLWWYRTAPESPFLQEVFCALNTDTGRVVIKGNRLTVVHDGEKSTEDLTSAAELLAAYRKWFGFELDRAPEPPAPGGAGVHLP
ncbi:arylamine N-acetyltransferase [Saccharothrix sp. HUAS TT1]|uniref:arylamine N-acetyltransferase family protein n=1 Tax=unclassified Saccharothrix TaxID=2593673 RepID=UPI00345C43BB